MKHKGKAMMMMIAVLAMLLAAGCTSSPEQASCPITPEGEAANQSENVTSPIKLTEGDDQAVPCAGTDSNQGKK